MKLWKLIPALFLLICSSFSYPHAIYISVIELNKTPGNKIIMNCKVFSDDLQSALRNYSSSYKHSPIDLVASSNAEIIPKYFNERLLVHLDGVRVLFKYNGYEQESDAHFLSFEGTFQSEPKEITIKADYFMELFPDQSNVIKLNWSEEVGVLMGRTQQKEKSITLKLSP